MMERRVPCKIKQMSVDLASEILAQEPSQISLKTVEEGFVGERCVDGN